MRKFLDTAPLIYIVQDLEDFAVRTMGLISSALVKGGTFVTGVITLLEFGVKPEKENRQDIILKFHEFLGKINCQIEEVDVNIAKKDQLRAKYTFLKGMDAIQIATALMLGCEEFITNDIKLARIEEIKVTLIQNH